MTAKKAKPPPDDPEQSARFIATATGAGAVRGDDFEKAIRIVVPPRQKMRQKKRP